MTVLHATIVAKHSNHATHGAGDQRYHRNDNACELQVAMLQQWATTRPMILLGDCSVTTSGGSIGRHNVNMDMDGSNDK